MKNFDYKYAKKEAEAAVAKMPLYNCSNTQRPYVDGFVCGARWAQQEFVKSLWHDASEEPRKFSQIIVEVKIGDLTECITLKRTDDYMYDWEYSCQVLNISRWFYLSEILPKEGGEG